MNVFHRWVNVCCINWNGGIPLETGGLLFPSDVHWSRKLKKVERQVCSRLVSSSLVCADRMVSTFILCWKSCHLLPPPSESELRLISCCINRRSQSQNMSSACLALNVRRVCTWGRQSAEVERHLCWYAGESHKLYHVVLTSRLLLDYRETETNRTPGWQCCCCLVPKLFSAVTPPLLQITLTIKSENNEIETYLTCCSPPAVALHPPLWEPLVYTADVLFIFHKSMRRFQTPLCTNWK